MTDTTSESKSAYESKAGNNGQPADTWAFRAWVRTHHPDVGGDPTEFVIGLTRWRTTQQQPRQVAVSAYRRRHGPAATMHRWRARRSWRRHWSARLQ